MAVGHTAHQVWDRHSILAALKRRFGSLKAFAETTPLAIGHYSQALGSPYPKAERYIARGLGVPLNELWPDRYDSMGQRRANATRANSARDSQKAAATSDIAGSK